MPEPKATIRRSTLDDSEGDDYELQDEEVHLDEPEDHEEPEPQSQAKRIKLTCKTSSSSTVYGNAQPQGEGKETKRPKKRAFDYDEVKKGR